MKVKRITLVLIGLILALVGCQNTSPDPPARGHREPTCSEVKRLTSWYSPSRGDNFASTHSTWDAPIGSTRSPDYKAYRHEGFIFRTRQPGTIPLYRWYSPSRGDNFITSDPSWAGSSGDTRSPDYRFSQLEGYIFDPARPQPANTLPLDSSYSPGRGDNIASTSANFTGSIGKTNSPDYRLFRREGYIIDPSHLNCEGDTPLSSLRVTITTGGDDLRGGSQAYADVRLENGYIGEQSLNRGVGWNNNSVHTATITLPANTRLGDLNSLRLRHDGAPVNIAQSYDNWNMNQLVVDARTANGDHINVLEQSGTPLVRFTGEQRQWTRAFSLP